MVELRLYTASMRVQIFHFLINIIKFINYKKKFIVSILRYLMIGIS